MFEIISEKFQNIFRNLRKPGRLTDDNIKAALREVQLVLLEADVNYKVVKEFIRNISEKAVGQQALRSLQPGQQVIKVVHEELINLLGKSASSINIVEAQPMVIMVVGLQGGGKTTTVAKLAKYFSKQNYQCLLAAADVYRPAAVKQLEVLGNQLNIPVFSGRNDPVKIATDAVKLASRDNKDIVIIDTAGRLHIDQTLMKELVDMKKATRAHEILLVADAMTGQDAVNIAREYQDILGIDGVVLTKMDGDARGGAAISICAVTGKPVKFIGNGEKLDNLELFYPDRMASRILGMGDILSLIDKAEFKDKAEQKKALEKKMRKETLTLEDFLDQLKQMRKLGSMQEILQMLPAQGQFKNLKIDEGTIKKQEAIINSMTKEERKTIEIINGQRRRRIAQGSGTSIQDVNLLIKNFIASRKMLKGLMKQGGIMGKRGLFPTSP